MGAAMRGARRTWRRGAAVAGSLAAVAGASAAPALAVPALEVRHFASAQVGPGARFTYATIMQNVGDAPIVDPMELTVELPQHVTLTNQTPNSIWSCDGTAGTVHCVYDTSVFGPIDVGGVMMYGGGPLLQLRADESTPDGPLAISTSFTGGGGMEPVPPHTEWVDVRRDRPVFGVTRFASRTLDRAGAPATTAGARPHGLETLIDFSTRTNANGQTVVSENVKDISVELPPGFVGNPIEMPRCTETQLQQPSQAAAANCPAGSQIGQAELYVGDSLFRVGVYNMVAPEGIPARFAFGLIGKVVHMDAALRSGTDYGLTINTRNIDQTLSINGIRLTMWGKPTDPVFGFSRGDCGAVTILGWPGIGCPVAGDTTPRGFLANQTSCGASVTRMTATSWRGSRATAAYRSQDANGQPLDVAGCDLVPFAADVSVQPASRVADEPTGLAVELSIPQPSDPDGLVTSHLRRVVVTLPEGMAVSPSSADGLGACSPAQIGLRAASDPTCPDSSKIGTVSIDTPLLEKPMEGAIHLASQRDNPFGTTLALYVVAKGPGVIVKLAGRIEPDPVTGRITATFDDNPQLPFSRFRLQFKGGPRAALVNPPSCGEKTVVSVLTPWSGGEAVTDTDSFAISHDRNGAPCPARAPFAPGFVAGTRDAVAGRYSPLLVRVSREDREQTLSTIDMGMPRGLIGNVASVPLCDDARAAAGTCAEASRIGSVTTAAGPGATPLNLPGRVYLTSSYKGAPYGLSIVVPAVAGPFDLGTVVVRGQIHIDPVTTELRIATDPLPTILEGIPLRIRRAAVAVDRPGFVVNATRCEETAVTGRIGSTAGTVANVRSRYRLAGCAALPFTPRMTLKVGARGRTRGDVTTPLDVTLRMPAGHANARSVKVTLPKAINARLNVIRNACSLAEFNAGASRCIRIGTAVAVTPLLRDPLLGAAYFVRNPARRLPDLMVSLRGQGTAKLVAVNLTGKVTVPPNLSLRTTFDTIPDVPIRSFSLRIQAGRNGPVGIVRNLCAAPTRRGLNAALAFGAQSGKRVSRTQRMQVAGCPKDARPARPGAPRR